MQLSAHFSLEEFITSETAAAHGIDNTPSAEIIEALKDTATRLEAIRAALGQPMHINSGYRCEELNKAVGGVPDSAHLTGHAVDFVAPSFGNPDGIIQQLLLFPNLEFDQIIIECHAWVHISFAPAMRRQIMTAHMTEGGMSYATGA